MTNANITRTETRAATARARWMQLCRAAATDRQALAAIAAAANDAADNFTRGTDDWFDMALEFLADIPAGIDLIVRIEDGE